MYNIILARLPRSIVLPHSPPTELHELQTGREAEYPTPSKVEGGRGPPGDGEDLFCIFDHHSYQGAPFQTQLLLYLIVF